MVSFYESVVCIIHALNFLLNDIKVLYNFIEEMLIFFILLIQRSSH